MAFFNLPAGLKIVCREADLHPHHPHAEVRRPAEEVHIPPLVHLRAEANRISEGAHREVPPEAAAGPLLQGADRMPNAEDLLRTIPEENSWNVKTEDILPQTGAGKREENTASSPVPSFLRRLCFF